LRRVDAPVREFVASGAAADSRLRASKPAVFDLLSDEDLPAA
jgi:hypothetical protein